MKKFLSIVLSLAIVASCVAMLTFTANAADKLTVDFEGENPFTAPVTGNVTVEDGGVSGKCLKFVGAANSWGAPFLNPDATKSVITAAGKYTVEFDIKMDTQPGKGFSIISRYGSSNKAYGTVADSKSFETGKWIHVTKSITVGEECAEADFKLGFDSFDHDGGARYIDNFEIYAGAPTYYAAGIKLSNNNLKCSITNGGIFTGIDFGGKDTKEVEFAVFAAKDVNLQQVLLCQGWGSSFYNGKWDDAKWNTAVENDAWNKMNPDKTAKAVDKYIEDGNHPEQLTGTSYSDKEGLTMARFTVNVPAAASVVNFQTQYLLKGKEISEKFASAPGNQPEGEKDTDYAEFKYVTPASNAYTVNDFALRFNGSANLLEGGMVYIYCISDPIVNSNIANAAGMTGIGSFIGLKDEAALQAATSADFIKLIKETPAKPTEAPGEPTAKPTEKPAATPIVKDAYEVKGEKLTMGQLVHANAGITTLPDGNNSVSYEVKNPNAYDIVVCLMMQTGVDGENGCSGPGWRFVLDAEGKQLGETFTTVKAGETKKITFTFPVSGNKVKCAQCKGEHDVSSLWIRFDAYKAEKLADESGYVKLTDGSFIVLKTDNATLDGYLAKLAAGNAAIMTATTVEIPVASGDMMPVALIACVAVAATALVVVSKKRKED